MAEFALYGYFRSSAAFRVRIALNLKGIAPELRFVHLLRGGGEQHAEAYRALNPQAQIPTLIHQGQAIGQSLAAIEYLDEIHPQPPLLPATPIERARVRQIAYLVACDIHPVNNLRVANYLRDEIGAGAEAIGTWQRHWMQLGFEALESLLGQEGTGRFCHGNSPTLADICLIPQLANARRASLDLAPYPKLLAIEETALALPAFRDALPANQPDAE
ncbi:MAG: maleylacetoacetate isomerase [Alphaproteobacteria bacterium]|nr:maleylacetoacetate isomerase [Alphaproteobacteria bacterium]